MTMRIKHACTVLIYKKLHSVNLSSLNKISAGKIINIVANDLNSLMGATFILQVILCPAILAFTMIFLWMEFGVYSL